MNIINSDSNDYSDYHVIKSNLPRVKEVANRLNYNWSDYILEFQDLIDKYKPQVDLKAGTPNFMPAQTVLDALVNVAINQTDPHSYEIHQYTTTTGHPRLLTAVANFHSLLLNRTINPFKEVLITAGTMQALDLVARSYLNRGDEVILFEPFYSSFRNLIKQVGAKLVTVPFTLLSGKSGNSSNDWTFNRREFESKINNKTKLIWLNNPNNPLGKVFTLEELADIGNIAIKHKLIIMCDEALQYYSFDEPKHIRIASLPGLYERTITLNSGGKALTNTGWRIGWVVAPEPLLWPLNTISSTSQTGVTTPLQIAFAMALEKEIQNWNTKESYFSKLNETVKQSSNKLVTILRSVGVDVIAPTVGYCVVANFTKLINQIDLSSQNDTRSGMGFVKYMITKGGIVGYPLSLFSSPEKMWQAQYSMRFVSLKTEETLNLFEKLLTQIFKRL